MVISYLQDRSGFSATFSHGAAAVEAKACLDATTNGHLSLNISTDCMELILGLACPSKTNLFLFSILMDIIAARSKYSSSIIRKCSGDAVRSAHNLATAKLQHFLYPSILN